MFLSKILVIIKLVHAGWGNHVDFPEEGISYTIAVPLKQWFPKCSKKIHGVINENGAAREGDSK